MNDTIAFVDLCVYLKDSQTLIFSDVHIGYEEALNKQGVFVPRFQFKETLQRLEKILSIIHPKTIVINGDIKHEFGTISDQEWRETLKLIDFLATKCEELILVRGNHDTILGPIAAKKNITIVEHYLRGSVFCVHGDKMIAPPKEARTVIIGHQHPAIGLRATTQRDELFKCFLVGTWEDKQLIVLPSFNLVTEGVDVLQAGSFTPYIEDMEPFSVHVPDAEDGCVRYFGMLRDFKE